SASLRAESLGDLFQKTKSQVKAGQWSEALKTLDALDAEAARPGNESYRRQLEGPTAFYRGVCEANLDRADAARASFQTFLAAVPNASIDPAMYSKKAVAAFEAAARQAGAHGAPAAVSGTGSLFQAYQEFKPPPNAADPPDAQWADGPAQFLMTAEEKRTWAGLSTDGDRAEFVEKFWESRNPHPGSGENTYRTGFERRVAFADAHFNQDEKKRGSMTDRGMVFVLLGAPTWGGRRPIRSGEDTAEAAGMSTTSSGAIAVAQANAQNNSPNGRITSGQSAAIADRMSGPGTQAAESNNNYQEVWHYRKELLPKNVGYLQVDVVFVTKHGYGSNVLQRDSATLATLAAAKKKPADEATAVPALPAAPKPGG
ncbi:MAG TPA: GWxTD domain-containing protein, partial [Thermoanaerobaculia bacterium]|nr:GWxTD domain-containing protein [Thermoanaerobaculia bacterium]